VDATRKADVKECAMSEAFGLGDGNNDLSTVGAMAEAQVVASQRRQLHHADVRRWPRAHTVVRLVATLVVAVVLLGWILTAVNGGS
jgi:hypothetical protein